MPRAMLNARSASDHEEVLIAWLRERHAATRSEHRLTFAGWQFQQWQDYRDAVEREERHGN